MYVHPHDDSFDARTRRPDPLSDHLGSLANRAAQSYQGKNYVAAGFALGELHSYIFEHFTDAWCMEVVDWITDALDVCEQAAQPQKPQKPHFRVTIDELPFELGQTEPHCDCLSCDVVASYATTVELEEQSRISRSCPDHVELVANVMLENMGSSIQIRNDVDTVAHV